MIVGPNDPHHPLLGTSTWILHSTARISTAAAVGGGARSPGRALPPIPTPAGRAAIWGVRTWEGFPGGRVATTSCEPLA